MKTELLTMSADYANEIYAREELLRFESDLCRLVSVGDSEATSAFQSLMEFRSIHYGHYLYEEGEQHPYRILDLAGQIHAPARKKLFLDTLVSVEPLLPIDFQANVAQLLLSDMKNGEYALSESEIKRLKAFIDCCPPLRLRSKQEMSQIKTDGIDHLFPIPESGAERLRLVRHAAELKAKERSALVVTRLLEQVGHSALRPEYAEGLRSLEAEALIENDLGTTLLKATDFLVPWTQILTSEEDGLLSLAELSRITLMGPEFKLPDEVTRLALVGYYRSVLRICGRSIIGLGSGVFHVEHGTLCEPSYFYMGRGSILGKGCLIDGVGGAVLLKESFIGGGFMPILVHTHKHVRAKGEAAAKERKKLLPAVFTMSPGVRFPMTRIGLFETADYLSRSSDIEGVRALPISSSGVALQSNGEIHV